MGGIASAYFSGALVDAYGPRGVFGLTAVFPLMVSLSAVFISEQPVASTARHRRNSGDGQQDKAESGAVIRMVHSQSLWCALLHKESSANTFSLVAKTVCGFTALLLVKSLNHLEVVILSVILTCCGIAEVLQLK